MDNLLITETANHVIRKVSSSGIIGTLAGNGTAGFSGDGGQAVNTQFNEPSGVAVDSSGNVYVADTSNYAIRKIPPKGVITTVVGTGVPGYSGMGLECKAHTRVRRICTGGIVTTIAGDGTLGVSGDGGSATGVCLAGTISTVLPGECRSGSGGDSYVHKYDANGVEV